VKTSKEGFMKKKGALCILVVAVLCIIGIACVVYAITAEEEAKEYTDRAAVFFKANGVEKTRAAIEDPKGPFTKGDLYVFIMDFNGVHIANGGNPKLDGLNHMELKDPNGVFLTKEMIQVAKTKGTGWVNYSWVNPVTKKVQPKTTYVKRIEGSNYYIAAGVWK
jgi:cytochrome c